MQRIKFSHPYQKLKDNRDKIIKTVKLLGVYPIQLKNQGRDFLNYDTDNGALPLPKSGLYIMLLFEKPRHSGRNLFTTLRPAWPSQKVEYYKSKIGLNFNIVLTAPVGLTDPPDFNSRRTKERRIGTPIFIDPDRRSLSDRRGRAVREIKEKRRKEFIRHLKEQR